jgi:hypothetical protein
MKGELSSLWSSLHDGEYLYLVLESLLPFGLAAAVLFLALSFGLRDFKLRLIGLALGAATGLTVWPGTEMRMKSLPRVLVMTEEIAFKKLIEDQALLRASWNGLYYGITVLCVMALFSSVMKRGHILTILALVGCCYGAAHGLWLHKKECEVYHRNIVKQHGR